MDSEGDHVVIRSHRVDHQVLDVDDGPSTRQRLVILKTADGAVESRVG